MGVLRSAAHRRAESRFWGVFIFAVHRAFVLGLGARHRGIVDLSEGVIRCVTAFACYSYSSSSSRANGWTKKSDVELVEALHKTDNDEQ